MVRARKKSAGVVGIDAARHGEAVIWLRKRRAHEFESESLRFEEIFSVGLPWVSIAGNGKGRDLDGRNHSPVVFEKF
jgi:hypothetical protein